MVRNHNTYEKIVLCFTVNTSTEDYMPQGSYFVQTFSEPTHCLLFYTDFITLLPVLGEHTPSTIDEVQK